MTIKQVADKASLCEFAVSRAEHNKPLEIATLKKLSIVLEQPIWWLGYFDNLPDETLPQRITKCRLYHGLTKMGFANKLNVIIKTVRLWECGKSTPTEDSLKLLAPYLSIIHHSAITRKTY